MCLFMSEVISSFRSLRAGSQVFDLLMLNKLIVLSADLVHINLALYTRQHIFRLRSLCILYFLILVITKKSIVLELYT